MTERKSKERTKRMAVFEESILRVKGRKGTDVCCGFEVSTIDSASSEAQSLAEVLKSPITGLRNFAIRRCRLNQTFLRCIELHSLATRRLYATRISHLDDQSINLARSFFVLRRKLRSNSTFSRAVPLRLDHVILSVRSPSLPCVHDTVSRVAGLVNLRNVLDFLTESAAGNRNPSRLHFDHYTIDKSKSILNQSCGSSYSTSPDLDLR